MHISREEFDRVLIDLDNPPEGTPALRKLLAEIAEDQVLISHGNTHTLREVTSCEICKKIHKEFVKELGVIYECE